MTVGGSFEKVRDRNMQDEGVRREGGGWLFSRDSSLWTLAPDQCGGTGLGGKRRIFLRVPR